MTTVETNTTDKAATVAAQGAPVAPEKAASKKAATQKKGASQGRKAAKAAKTKKAPKTSKPAAKAGKQAGQPRVESKGGKILAMIARTKGATLAEIMKAVDWQAHSVRGFVATAAKKYGVKIESARNDAGERVYRSVK